MNKSLISNSLNKTNRFALIGWSIVFALALYYINTNALRYFNINPLLITEFILQASKISKGSS